MERDALYRLEDDLRQRAAILFPGKMLFGIGECADILGKSRSTLYHDKKRYPLKARGNTIQQLAKVVSR